MLTIFNMHVHAYIQRLWYIPAHASRKVLTCASFNMMSMHVLSIALIAITVVDIGESITIAVAYLIHGAYILLII